MSGRTVLVVEHEASCPPALAGRWLEEAGLSLRVVRPYLGDDLPPALTGGGLLVLGGSMGASEDVRAPWLPAVRRLVRQAAQERIPTMGICLGLQLAAVALGGRAGRNPGGQTVGARAVVRDGAVDGDPVAAALPVRSLVPQWNDDTVLALPPGATPVAHNDRGDLLMARLAETVWGIQGHPEASASVVARWAHGQVADGALTGASPGEIPGILADLERQEASIAAAWRPVLTAWAALLA